MFYIVYESYTEYNQFEGSWDLQIKKYDSLVKASFDADDMRGNSNYRNVKLLKDV